MSLMAIPPPPELELNASDVDTDIVPMVQFCIFGFVGDEATHTDAAAENFSGTASAGWLPLAQRWEGAYTKGR